MELEIAKEKKIFTVSEITQDIKIIFENTFAEVWVEGEVSNFKAAASGHFYFTLKDKDACLAAAMFVRANRQLKFKLEDGLKVICFGKVDVYPPRGQYQLIVEQIEPKGIGAQQLAFEQLKAKLFKEGLFDPARKRQLPLMPQTIGIVTSKAGAAIRDILQILKKGAPFVDVVIRSTKVQGEGAAKEISEAIEDLNKFAKIDCLIISRGGGSIEDLWAFNEEVVARAISNSKIPTISAVGHQINTTLSDLTADVFVETPSAAAKIIVDKKNSLNAEIDGLKYEMNSAVTSILHVLSNSLTALRHVLKSPLDRLLEKQQFLDELISGLDKSIKHFIDITSERFSVLVHRLDALSPLAILSRGYSLTMLEKNEEVVRDASKLKKGDIIKTFLGKGSAISRVEEVSENEPRPSYRDK